MKNEQTGPGRIGFRTFLRAFFIISLAYWGGSLSGEVLHWRWRHVIGVLLLVAAYTIELVLSQRAAVQSPREPQERKPSEGAQGGKS